MVYGAILDFPDVARGQTVLWMLFVVEVVIECVGNAPGTSQRVSEWW